MSFTTIKFRRGPAAEWTTDNPVLKQGEPGYELFTGRLKIGDGIQHWDDLPAFLAEDLLAVAIDEAVVAALLDLDVGALIDDSSAASLTKTYSITKIKALNDAQDTVIGGKAASVHTHTLSQITDAASKADDSVVVKLSGAQTINGIKTFGSAPVVPNDSFSIAKTIGLQTELDAKAVIADGSASNATTTTYSANKINSAISTAIAALVGTAPSVLDTLGEISDALNDDANAFATLTTVIAGKQPLDSDLTTIAALTATTDSFMQAKAGAWAARTIAQVKTDLGLTGTNSGDQSSIVGITGTKTQFNTALSDGDFLFVGDAVGVTDGDKGDLTVSSTGTVWTIDNGVVTYAKVQDVSTAGRVLGRITAGAGDIEELSSADIRTIIGLTGTNTGDQTSIVGITGTKAQFDTAVTDGNILYVGDISQYTDEMAQDAVNAMFADSNTIDVTYVDGTPSFTGDVRTQMSITSDASGLKLAGDSASPGNAKLYGTDGSGVKGWYSQPGGTGITDGDKGDITVSSSGLVWTIDNSVVTLAKIANISTSRILGRITASSGVVEELTGSDIRTIAGLATSDTPQFTGIEIGHASDTTLTRSAAGLLAVEGVVIPTISSTSTLTNKTLTSPVINTPTGIAKADISGLGTSDSPQFTGIELGHASDTTLTRSSAGVLAVEGVVVPTISSTSTLTNKTLTTPRINTICDTNGNNSLTLQPAASATNYLRLDNAASGNMPSFVATGGDANISINLVPKGSGIIRAGSIEVVTISSTNTLTNKTLTSPVISSIVNTGTLTLPTSTDTLVGRATTDTLTNKTLTSPVINTPTGIVKSDISGLGTSDSPQFAAIELGAATDTTIARVSAGVISVEGKNVALNGTSEVHTIGSIELGAATDTTIARVSAGVISVEGVTIPTVSSTSTLTNKTLTAPVITDAVLNATTLVTDTTTGLKIGTGTTQKIGFFNSTPIVQPTGNALTALSNLGLVASPTLAESDITSLVSDLAGKQPLDSDLTTIAGLTATTDSFMQAKSGAWASRTIAQVKTDLGLTGTNSGDQTSIVGITGTKAQFNTAVSDGDIFFTDDTTIVSKTYLFSRENGLVTNGDGQLGDTTNFSGTTFDDDDRPVGALGVFKSSTASHIITSTDSIPINPSVGYRTCVSVKQLSGSGQFYFGISPYDVDGLNFAPYNYMEQANTRTTLAADLVNGATTITLTSSANWNNAAGGSTWLRNIIFWNYTDGKGKLWAAGTYSRNVIQNAYADGGISGNVITLSAPYSGSTIPAGTSISNGSSGTSFIYMQANLAGPSTWTDYLGSMKPGYHTDLTVPATDKFPQATAYVKLVILANYPTASSSVQGFSNINVYPIIDPLLQMSITSDASGLKLSGDSATPGNSKLYGTNGSGVKGWYDQPAGGAGVSDGDKGDITVSSTGTVWTIDNGVVTLAKMANMATSRVLGRISASSGVVEELTGANLRTIEGTATSDSPQFAGIELGHATDTTIARVSAGVISVEGVTISTASNTLTLTNKTLTSPVISSISNTGTLTLPTSTDTLVGRATTDTLTNKRITSRTGTTTSSATPTINTDNVDFYSITALTTAITSMTTNLSGTPTEDQKLRIAITGTAARAITWGSSFEASTVSLPTTTVGTARLDVGFVWNAVTSKWRCVAVA